MISASHGMHAVVTDTRDRRFELLAMSHLDAAFNLARWLTGNMADAENVVQDAYRRAFRYLDTFRGDNFRVWLLTLVHPGRSHQGRFGGKRAAHRSDRPGDPARCRHPPSAPRPSLVHGANLAAGSRSQRGAGKCGLASLARLMSPSAGRARP
jgi:hypothetical protein